MTQKIYRSRLKRDTWLIMNQDVPGVKNLISDIPTKAEIDQSLSLEGNIGPFCWYWNLQFVGALLPQRFRQDIDQLHYTFSRGWRMVKVFGLPLWRGHELFIKWCINRILLFAAALLTSIFNVQSLLMKYSKEIPFKKKKRLVTLIQKTLWSFWQF